MAVGLGIGLAFGPPSIASAAIVEIDCDDESDFCTGDPCTTTDTLVITSPVCSLDFSPRELRIDRVVKVPNGGTLSLTAGSIEVKRKIDGKHVKSTAGDGAHVSLIATGDIDVDKKIEAEGDTAGGVLEAIVANDLTVQGRYSAVVGGCIGFVAGGTLPIVPGSTFDPPQPTPSRT